MAECAGLDPQPLQPRWRTAMSGKHPLVQAIEQSQLKQNVPSFSPGDTVVVQVKVKEGDRERLGL